MKLPTFAVFASRLLLALTLVPVIALGTAGDYITDTRVTLPSVRHGVAGSAQAAFAVGLVRVPGEPFRTDAAATDYITVSGSLSPETAHIGQKADVLAVALVGGSFYMIDADQKLLPWNGRVDSLVARHANVDLKASGEYTLYSGKIAAAGDVRFFMGYRLASNGALYYTSTAQRFTINSTPAAIGSCKSYGGRTVPVWHTSADGLFTHTPFRAEDLSLITNGDETNDPRFSYQWVKSRGDKINIYAPADGVLIRIRHKAKNLPEFDSNDYDLFFLASCDPAIPDKNVVIRFNHITDPRPDLLAAFGYGDQGAPSFKPVFEEREDLQVPVENIVVRAGDWLGATSGTPVARDFDFQIAIDDVTVCPFSVLAEPHRTQLLNMLGPITASPFGPPAPGYACKGYGRRP